MVPLCFFGIRRFDQSETDQPLGEPVNVSLASSAPDAGGHYNYPYLASIYTIDYSIALSSGPDRSVTSQRARERLPLFLRVTRQAFDASH